jgi:hypothetical protein
MDNRERIITLWREVNRPGIEDLISFLETSDFFEAPCSINHHLAKVGGLAEHSLNVYELLAEKAHQYGLWLESINISALAHDFCKINYFKPGGDQCSEPQFNFLKSLLADKKALIDKESLGKLLDIVLLDGAVKRDIPAAQATVLIEWLKNKPGSPIPEMPISWSYEDREPLGHGEKSLIILQRFIKLELYEMLAIRWHMGAWDLSDVYGKYAFNEAVKVHPLVILLQTADLEATHILEKE